MNEHDTVVLKRALPDQGLEPGDVGVILHVYNAGKGFEVEFIAGSGTTIAVMAPDANDIRPVASSEILHVRNIPA